MAYILGVDIGTSGTKTVLFSEDGTPVASALYDYPDRKSVGRERVC